MSRIKLFILMLSLISVCHAEIKSIMQGYLDVTQLKSKDGTITMLVGTESVVPGSPGKSRRPSDFDGVEAQTGDGTITEISMRAALSTEREIITDSDANRALSEQASVFDKVESSGGGGGGCLFKRR